MPEFEYYVKDSEGQDRTGQEEAADTQALVGSLQKKGFLVVRIKEVKQKKPFFFDPGVSVPSGKRGRIKIEDLIIFSRQLATLVGAGIPLLQGLEILIDQSEKAELKTVTRALHEDVKNGRSLSESLEKHSRAFPLLFTHMVRAGESSGHLEEILDRLAGYLEKTSALQKKIRSAVMYPEVVSVMALLITVGMMTFVIPKFAEIFYSINAPLPTPTRLLIVVSNFLRANIFYLSGGLVAAFVSLKRWGRTKSGKVFFDTLKLRMPIFGKLFLKSAITKFCRTLATLTKSGVPILSSLEIVAHTSGNVLLENLILSLRTSVMKGEGLSRLLSESPLMPPMVVKMIAVGEETGELETMLVKIADFYDAEVDTAVSGLTSLIEPLVIAFLGIVIGGIVMAMFLPILTLTQAIH